MLGLPAVEATRRSIPGLSGFLQKLSAHALHRSVQLLANEFCRQPTVRRDCRPRPAGQPFFEQAPFFRRESTKSLLAKLDPGQLLTRRWIKSCELGQAVGRICRADSAVVAATGGVP